MSGMTLSSWECLSLAKHGGLVLLPIPVFGIQSALISLALQVTAPRWSSLCLAFLTRRRSLFLTCLPATGNRGYVCTCDTQIPHWDASSDPSCPAPQFSFLLTQPEMQGRRRAYVRGSLPPMWRQTEFLAPEPILGQSYPPGQQARREDCLTPSTLLSQQNYETVLL